MTERPWLAHYDEGVPQSLEPYPRGTLLDDLRRHARERPDDAALIFKGRRMSWGELERLSTECASAFAALGVGRGDRVALLLPNCPQYLIAQLGLWKLGAVVVALNPIYTEHELVAPLSDTRVRLALTLTKFYDRLKAAQPKTKVERVIATNIKEYLPPALAVLFTLFKEKKEGHRITLAPGDLWFRDLMREHRGRTVAPAPIGPDDDAIVLASGGTTGTPKGVVGQHKGFVYAGTQIYGWTRSMFVAGRDIILVPLPLCHVYANVGGIGLGLVTGSPLALVPNPRDLPDVLKTIAKVRPAFMLSVPTLFQAMLNNPAVQQGKVDFSSIKISFSGAMALMKATKERFEALTGGRIIEGYSLTEAMMACLVNPLAGTNKIGSIGMPLPDVDAMIVDTETGRERMPAGQEGELILCAPQLMREYFENPNETSQTLRRREDGRLWLHTGDIGYMDEDGYVFLTDRKKDLIKTGGFQVWPREVEEVLAAHPAVAEVGVAGVPDPQRGELVKAWVVLRAGHTATLDELRCHCREKLAPYKVPAEVEFRTELPKTLVGKILRRELVRQHTSAA
ncbi:MAG TPA: AMP-binding protein [Vicinamibacterales bacterium]